MEARCGCLRRKEKGKSRKGLSVEKEKGQQRTEWGNAIAACRCIGFQQSAGDMGEAAKQKAHPHIVNFQTSST